MRCQYQGHKDPLTDQDGDRIISPGTAGALQRGDECSLSRYACSCSDRSSIATCRCRRAPWAACLGYHPAVSAHCRMLWRQSALSWPAPSRSAGREPALPYHHPLLAHSHACTQKDWCKSFGATARLITRSTAVGARHNALSCSAGTPCLQQHAFRHSCARDAAQPRAATDFKIFWCLEDR